MSHLKERQEQRKKLILNDDNKETVANKELLDSIVSELQIEEKEIDEKKEKHLKIAKLGKKPTEKKLDFSIAKKEDKRYKETGRWITDEEKKEIIEQVEKEKEEFEQKTGLNLYELLGKIMTVGGLSTLFLGIGLGTLIFYQTRKNEKSSNNTIEDDNSYRLNVSLRMPETRQQPWYVKWYKRVKRIILKKE